MLMYSKDLLSKRSLPGSYSRTQARTHNTFSKYAALTATSGATRHAIIGYNFRHANLTNGDQDGF